MGNKLKAISKVSVALALLGAAVPAVEAAPTAMAAKKATKKAKKSTKKTVKKSTKKAKKAKKTTKKKATKKVAKKTATKKPAKKSVKKTTKKSVKKVAKKTAKKASTKKTTKKSTSKISSKSNTDKQIIVMSPGKQPTKKIPAKYKTSHDIRTSLFIANRDDHPVQLYDSKGNATKYFAKANSKFYPRARALINGQDMYKIGTDKQWVPESDILDYFTNSDTYPAPTYNKIPDDQWFEKDDSAETEKALQKNPNDRDYIDYASTCYEETHPLQLIHMNYSDRKAPSDPNTEAGEYDYYEEYRYATDITYKYEIWRENDFHLFTKVSYLAYMKGKDAYIKYVKAWEAAHPNIMKCKSVQKEIKKYKLSSDMWYDNQKLCPKDKLSDLLAFKKKYPKAFLGLK